MKRIIIGMALAIPAACTQTASGHTVYFEGCGPEEIRPVMSEDGLRVLYWVRVDPNCVTSGGEPNEPREPAGPTDPTDPTDPGDDHNGGDTKDKSDDHSRDGNGGSSDSNDENGGDSDDH